MMDSDTIRSQAPRPQINPQLQQQAIRPPGPPSGINANLAGPRPTPQQLGQQQQPIRGPPPQLRRADSRQFIPTQQVLQQQQQQQQQQLQQGKPPLQQLPGQYLPNQGQRPPVPLQQQQQFPPSQRPPNPNSTPIVRPISTPPTSTSLQQQPLPPQLQNRPPNPSQSTNRPQIQRPQVPPQNIVQSQSPQSQQPYRQQPPLQRVPSSNTVRSPAPTTPPGQPIPSAIKSQNSVDIYQKQFDPNTNMSADISVFRQEPPRPSSVLSNDDDDDVVIGRATDSPIRTTINNTVRAPEAQIPQNKTPALMTTTTTNPQSHVPLQRTDSKQFISARPPSASDFNRTSPENNITRTPIQNEYKPTSDSGLRKILENESTRMSNEPPPQRPPSVTFKEEPKYQQDKYKISSPDIPNPKTPVRSPVSLNSIINPISGSDSGGLRAKPTEVKEKVITPTSEKFRTSPMLKSELMNGETRRESANRPLKSSLRFKGDNDSGVDETTQGHERPESLSSPLKSPSKPSGFSRPPSATPSNKSQDSKARSLSKTRTLKTPETPVEPIIKKVPMNKIQVGNAPSPNLKQIRSKIGSLENASHKPGGGHVKIETKKTEYKVDSKIVAKNDKYTPRGGDKKISTTKLQWNAKSKIGSLENAHHKPGGGDKKIESIKADFKDKAKSKVGSKDNVDYKPGGGDVKSSIIEEQPLEDPKMQIQSQKLDIKAQSKIGSLNNVKYKPGGGDKKIFDDKDYLKNVEHPVSPMQPSQSPSPAPPGAAGADENLNEHQS